MCEQKLVELYETAINMVSEHIHDDNVCAEELGEVMDIAKDCMETWMYFEKAKYYKEVVKAMETATPEQIISRLK